MSTSRSGWCLAITLVTLLAACGPDPGNTAEELGTALDEAYPQGWRFAVLDRDSRTGMPPGASPAWIGGDFNGDSRSDYAAQVVVWKLGHTASVDSAQLVVALLRRRRNGFNRQVLSVGGGPSTGIYLVKIPRGETVRDYEGRSSIELRSDAVHQIFVGQASVAHVYDDGRWREIFTGD